ncbi:hypothetical protein AB5N19_12559 [Seiridium cardinale]
MTSEPLSNDASYGLLAFDHFIAQNFDLTQPQASDPHQYRELALRYLRLTPLERFPYHSCTFEESAEPPLPSDIVDRALRPFQKPRERNASVRRGTTGGTEHPLWLRTCYAPDLALRYAELRSQCEVGCVYAVDAADCFDDAALYDAEKDEEVGAGDRDGVGEGNAGLRALLLRAPMLADVVQYNCPEDEEFWGEQEGEPLEVPPEQEALEKASTEAKWLLYLVDEEVLRDEDGLVKMLWMDVHGHCVWRTRTHPGRMAGFRGALADGRSLSMMVEDETGGDEEGWQMDLVF